MIYQSRRTHHARGGTETRATLVIALKYLLAIDNMFERIRLRFAMPKFGV